MNYKLKSKPEIVWFVETKQFTIEDENGVEHTIRHSENSKGYEFLILKDGNWEDISDRELKMWIIDELPEEEEQ